MNNLVSELGGFEDDISALRAQETTTLFVTSPTAESDGRWMYLITSGGGKALDPTTSSTSGSPTTPSNHYMQRLDAWSTKQTDLAVRHQIRRALEDQKRTDVLGFLISTTGHASAHVRAAG